MKENVIFPDVEGNYFSFKRSDLQHDPYSPHAVEYRTMRGLGDMKGQAYYLAPYKEGRLLCTCSDSGIYQYSISLGFIYYKNLKLEYGPLEGLVCMYLRANEHQEDGSTNYNPSFKYNIAQEEVIPLAMKRVGEQNGFFHIDQVSLEDGRFDLHFDEGVVINDNVLTYRGKKYSFFRDDKKVSDQSKCVLIENDLIYYNVEEE